MRSRLHARSSDSKMELERQLVLVGQSLLTDDSLHGRGVTTNSVLGVQLVGNIAVVLAGHALANGRLHETRERGKNVDGRVDTTVVHGSVDENLALRDVASQIGNGVGNVLVGHGQNGDLGDGTVTARDTTSSLVNGRQIRVHVTGETTTTGHLLTGGGDLTKSVAVGGQIRKNDQNVLLEL
ncbi:hypothetical protein BN1723_008386, partial [Verticillium longisporum]